MQELYDRGSALVNTRMRAVCFHVRILGAEKLCVCHKSRMRRYDVEDLD